MYDKVYNWRLYFSFAFRRFFPYLDRAKMLFVLKSAPKMLMDCRRSFFMIIICLYVHLTFFFRCVNRNTCFYLCKSWICSGNECKLFFLLEYFDRDFYLKASSSLIQPTLEIKDHPFRIRFSYKLAVLVLVR